MRINRRLIKRVNSNQMFVSKKTTKRISDAENADRIANASPRYKENGVIRKASEIQPFSIVIPFSSDMKDVLDENCLSYLNKCFAIDKMDIILVLYQDDYTYHNFDQFQNINYRIIHSKRNNDDNLFCLSHARNIGIRYAFFDWVLCMDCDMFLPENFTIMMSAIMKTKNRNSVFWTHRYNVGSLERRKTVKYIDKSPFGFFHFFYKKNILEKVGGYDERISGWGLEDDDFIDRCKKSEITLQCMKDRLPLYHVVHNYNPIWKNEARKEVNIKIKKENEKNNITKITGVLGEVIGSEFAGRNFYIKTVNNFRNKFVIFGSGPNIEKLNIDKFNKISENYSTLGFAWFYKSGFIPDYYYCHEELSRSNQGMEIIEFLKKNSKFKRTTLFTTPEHINYIKNKKWYNIPAIEVGINCYKDNFWNVQSKTPKMNINHLWANSLTPPNNKLFLTRSQLESAINLVQILGAQEIILHGVELNDNNHFCTTDATEGKNVFHKELISKVNFDPQKDTHCSTIDYDNCLGIQYILAEIKKMLDIKKIGFFSSDSNSLLVRENILPYHEI